MPNFARQGGRFSASAFNFAPVAAVSATPAGAGSITLASSPVVSAADGTPFTPFSTTAPLTFGFGLANQETVTPSAVSYTTVPGAVVVTATFANAHNAGEQVASGSAGLQEALNYANTTGGGVVFLDSTWIGTAAQLNAAVPAALAFIEDCRGTNIPVSEKAVVSLTAQAAVIAATTAFTPNKSGPYAVNFYTAVTQAATTSSTLGVPTITYTDATSGVAQSIVVAGQTTAGAIATTATTNTTTTNLQGGCIINAKAGVAVQYAIPGYLSSGATPMQYNLFLRIEAL